MKHELRYAPKPTQPKYSVVKIKADGMGEDVAWFFKMKDAENYLKWLRDISANSTAARFKT